MTEIAVEGCSLEASIDGGMISTQLSITSVPSAKIKCKNGSMKGAYIEKLTVLVPSGTTVTKAVSGTTGTGILAAPASIDISGTSSKATSKNKSFILKGDEGSANISFTFTSTSIPPSPVPTNIKVTVKVSNAGQTKVLVT